MVSERQNQSGRPLDPMAHTRTHQEGPAASAQGEHAHSQGDTPCSPETPSQPVDANSPDAAAAQHAERAAADRLANEEAQREAAERQSAESGVEAELDEDEVADIEDDGEGDEDDDQ